MKRDIPEGRVIPDGHKGEAVQPATAGQRTGPRGLASLCLVARLHQVAADPQALHHQLGLSPSLPVGVDDLLLAAKHLGLRAKHSRSNPGRLQLAALPALALLHDGRTVVLAQCDGQRVLLLDPDSPGTGQPARPAIEPLEAFAQAWSGELILIASRASLAGELARFDFSWFVPSLVKYRRLLGEVLLVSVFLQLFALVSPLFFQAVIDKVLVHRGMTTRSTCSSWVCWWSWCSKACSACYAPTSSEPALR